jgi:hypothetical protein
MPGIKLILVVIFLLPKLVHGGHLLSIDKDFDSTFLGGYISFFEDYSRTYNLNDILNKNPEFESATILNSIKEGSILWYQFTLKSIAKEPIRLVILGEGNYTSLELYEIDQNQESHILSLEKENTEIYTSLTLYPEKEYIYYIRFEPKGKTQITFSLWSEESFNLRTSGHLSYIRWGTLEFWGWRGALIVLAFVALLYLNYYLTKDEEEETEEEKALQEQEAKQIRSYLSSLEILVKTMKISLSCWEEITGKDQIELAQESRIWSAYLDQKNGVWRVRSMNQYLSLSTVPAQKPRWRKVAQTAEFILNILPENHPNREDLEDLLLQINEQFNTTN